tara:strand:- start:426 stop:998 length:573 start_codon:yes stop_codon:yes gene_type:complete
MGLFKKVVNIDNFSIENIDISDIENIINKLPKNGVIDINISERGLIYTLEGQNICQEHIAKVDRLISILDSKAKKAWSKAALEKSKALGHKTGKDKEWSAQADDDFIEASNELALAKACRKWFENKISYFSGWHYAFKSFLKRDYSIENATSLNITRYNENSMKKSEKYPVRESGESSEPIDWGDADWGD